MGMEPSQEIGQECGAGGAVSALHLWNLGQGDKELARPTDQALLILGGQSCEPKGLSLGTQHSEAALFEACVEDQPGSRNERQECEKQETNP
jgi:hypothetical protein